MLFDLARNEESRITGNTYLICCCQSIQCCHVDLVETSNSGVVVQGSWRLTRMCKVVETMPSHDIEEVVRSSCKPLPHPTQLQ